ncbi:MULTISPECIES: hypothetical protein [unclassified Frankia]|uniref:hypothetical protein n=1 Tax=unclassified Frankia TaxID=2632575 RepID=UPI000AAF4019|nr:MULTISPECIES: hypothetical protein [unclassified Frankia]
MEGQRADPHPITQKRDDRARREIVLHMRKIGEQQIRLLVRRQIAAALSLSKK